MDRFDQYLADLDLVFESLELPAETVFFVTAWEADCDSLCPDRPGALAGLVLSCRCSGCS